MERDFQAIVIRELSALFEPVIKSTQSVEDLERLLARLGWDPTLIPTDVVADVVAKFQETSVLVENIKSPPNNLVELLTFIDNVKDK